MRLARTILLAGGLLGIAAPARAERPVREVVVLLHGLCRTPASMRPLQAELERHGYAVVNCGYRSREAAISVLSEQALASALCRPEVRQATRIHFVTHSLGGILVRAYLAQHPLPRLGRVVMLGPPNKGSEVVDHLRGWWVFRKLNGPAGQELGTAPDSLPNRLGPVDFDLGVIAGRRSINWINSTMIPGPDDGKVAVERTKVAGMRDHLVLPVSHPFLMRDRRAIAACLQFLATGAFTQPR